jgi:hypothetical protein
MAPVGELLRAASLHRRRGLKEQTLRKGDMLIASWLIAVVFIRFTVNCAFAVQQLAAGSHAVGLVISEFSEFHLLLVVFLVTFLISSLSLGSTSLNRRRLGASPLSLPTLFMAELAGIFSNPMGVIVVPFIVPAMLPLITLAHPIAAVFTLIASFTAVYLLAWVLAATVSLSPRITESLGFFRILFAAVMLGLVVANFDFQWKGGTVHLYLFQHPFLLTKEGGGFLSLLSPWSPSSWIMSAAIGTRPLPWVFISFAGAGIAIVLSGVLINKALRGASTGSRSVVKLRGGKGKVPGKRRSILGLLFSHEASFLFSTSGTRLGILAGIAFSLWLLVTPDPTIYIPILGTVMVLITGFSYPSNVFGHDGTAVRRYTLLSLDWGELFLAKNLAYFASSAAPFALLAIATAIGVSVIACLSLALSMAVLVMLTVLWGNMSSILVPFSAGSIGSRAAPKQGVFVNQLFPVIVWGVPYVINRSLGAFDTPSYAAGMMGCLLVSVFIYRLLVRRISRHYSHEVEELAGKL